MAIKKTKKTRTKRAGRTVTHPRREARKVTHRKTGDVLKDTWYSTVGAITSAQEGLETQVRSLLKKNRIGTRDAATILKDVNSLITRERKKALKELEARLGTLQARARKERKVVARMVDDAVQAALAAFNIPSRQEVHELTRKVNELSKKIDSFRRRR
jgi:uncharacterized membrane protein